MTSFACFLAWLMQLPPVIRLVITSGRLLDAVRAILIDPETGAVRELDAWALDAVERALQAAEASISRAIWLRARQLAGLSRLGRPAPFRYFAPRNLSNTSATSQSLAQAMAMRAAHLLERLYRLERHARELAGAMTWTASHGQPPCAPAHPATSLGAGVVPLHALCNAFAGAQAHAARGPVCTTGPPHLAVAHFNISA